MPKTLLPGLLFVALVPLTACKTWYQAGANEDDLSRDQQHCEEQTGTATGKAFLKCMQRAGWQHNHISAAATESEAVSSSMGEAKAGRSTMQPHSATPRRATETKPASADTIPTTESPGDGKKLARPQQPGGWIQFGGDAEQLEDAKRACHETKVANEVFRECMARKGWRRIRLTLEGPGDLD